MNEMGYNFTLVNIDEIDDTPLKLTTEQGKWFEKVFNSTKKKIVKRRLR